MPLITADEAKLISDISNIKLDFYKERLANAIEESARQGNTSVVTAFPKHIPLEDIRALSAELTTLGYNVRFEVKEFYYGFDVYWL